MLHCKRALVVVAVMPALEECLEDLWLVNAMAVVRRLRHNR
jgi:hypothetical protein